MRRGSAPSRLGLFAIYAIRLAQGNEECFEVPLNKGELVYCKIIVSLSIRREEAKQGVRNFDEVRFGPVVDKQV